MSRPNLQGGAFVALAIAALTLEAACKDQRPAPGPGATTPTPSAATEDLSPLRHAAAGRIVAIGDLHGDAVAARAALRLAGAIDESDRWIGGNLVVVQTGDQIDRGDDDRVLLDLFDRLAEEAKRSGGAVIPLVGNHELMNVAGDFRYVTKGAFRAFEGAAPLAGADPRLQQFPEPFRPRAAAFAPGGPYARLLAKRSLVAIVGDSVFVHGGVLPAHVKQGLVKLDREARAWMDGSSSRAPEAVTRDDSLVWTRRYSEPRPSAKDCEMLDEVLRTLGVRRMVVGHTVQKRINSACNDKVWRIDVGLSGYYQGERIEVLEIAGDQTRVLGAARPER